MIGVCGLVGGLVFVIVFLALSEDEEEACGGGDDAGCDGESGFIVGVLVWSVEIGTVVFYDVVLFDDAARRSGGVGWVGGGIVFRWFLFLGGG